MLHAGVLLLLLLLLVVTRLLLLALRVVAREVGLEELVEGEREDGGLAGQAGNARRSSAPMLLPMPPRPPPSCGPRSGSGSPACCRRRKGRPLAAMARAGELVETPRGRAMRSAHTAHTARE